MLPSGCFTSSQCPDSVATCLCIPCHLHSGSFSHEVSVACLHMLWYLLSPISRLPSGWSKFSQCPDSTAVNDKYGFYCKHYISISPILLLLLSTSNKLKLYCRIMIETLLQTWNHFWTTSDFNEKVLCINFSDEKKTGHRYGDDCKQFHNLL